MDGSINQKPFLVVAYDRLGIRQAGPAIRTLALASELSQKMPVEVLYEGDLPESSPAGITFIRKQDQKFDSAFFEKYRAALVPPLIALILPEILNSSIPVVVDLFDPVIWENLELYKSKTLEERKFQHERHLAALLAAIFRGDYFLAAGHRQQDLIMGALMTANRMNPDTWLPRKNIGQIIGLVPFGLPNDPPPGRENLPLPEGIPSEGPIVVWGGGMWDWLEPEIVVKAWPDVLKRYPAAYLVFPGTEHPNPHVPVMAAVERVRKCASEMNINKSIIYGKWFPRNEYIALLTHASCGVSAHSPGLECRYAARTRYLDAIWTGLPLVASEGDEYAEYIADHRLGLVVRESNPSDFAQGIIRIIENGKASYADNFNRARMRLTWRRMAAPLVDWAEAPRITHGPGTEFFQIVVGKGEARKRPADLMSLMGRLFTKLKKI